MPKSNLIVPPKLIFKPFPKLMELFCDDEDVEPRSAPLSFEHIAYPVIEIEKQQRPKSSRLRHEDKGHESPHLALEYLRRRELEKRQQRLSRVHECEHPNGKAYDYDI